MEKNMEIEMGTGAIWGFKELTLSWYIGETISLLYCHIYTLW